MAMQERFFDEERMVGGEKESKLSGHRAMDSTASHKSDKPIILLRYRSTTALEHTESRVRHRDRHFERA